jgi:hypothetical protein
MIVSLSLVEIIPGLLLFAMLCLVGLGLHRMVKSRDKMLAEYRRREQVHQMATRFKTELLHELRPLGLRRISLAPYRKGNPVQHRRRLNLHSRLFHQDLLD